MTTTAGRIPDFIIIGAMKCATSTLHEQLARQPGIFMSSPKEPNFFSDDAQWARGLSWYSSLFATAQPGDICGESSTHYTKLPTYPHTIGRLKQHLPRDARLIYVMRHPIDRLISQYIHEWTQREIECDIDTAIDAHPRLIAYSQYAVQLRPYIEAFGRDQILPLFFERLTAEPQESLERVCAFIGYAKKPNWHDAADEQNVSSDRMRTSAWRDAIANMPGARALRRALVPKSMRERVKNLWMMKGRPQLSPLSVHRLEQTFDADLASLGEWFGLPGLSCANFTQFAVSTQPMWREEARVTAA